MKRWLVFETFVGGEFFEVKLFNTSVVWTSLKVAENVPDVPLTLDEVAENVLENVMAMANILANVLKEDFEIWFFRLSSISFRCG